MQGKVQIVADDSGAVIRQSKNNPDYGHVRLVQERVTFGNAGWVKRNVVSTLLHGTIEDLQETGIANQTTLPGKIVVKEQLTPFNEENPDRDLKYAGDTGIICCAHGEPIYRKTFFTTDANAEDIFVAHTNGDAIREANGTGNKLKDVVKATPEEAFEDNNSKQVDLEDSISEIENEEVVEDTVEEEEAVEAETFEL
tara:strand:- start:3550 stop:4140 length:591 start_codon:yes stop_codon:yes gene_type:complete